MNGKWTRFVIIGVGIGTCLLGTLVVFAYLLPIVGIVQKEYAPRCKPPVGGFSEANLVGTWVARIPTHSDTLIIKADGTYKQIIHIEFTKLPTIDYESDWQRWHLEYSKGTIPYLHLSGYAFCGMNDAIPCARRDGGGYDFCQDKYLPMNGEGILVVLEVLRENPSATGAKYYYFLSYPLGSENSYGYSLQEP